MPKSKSRSSAKKSGGSKLSYGANIGKTSSRTNVMVAVAAVLVLAVGLYYFWNQSQEQRQSAGVLEALAQEGQSILTQVQSRPNQGQQHLGAGQTKNYVEPFPTSGDHASAPVSAGYYDRELPKINLVHSLEHGNVVIYYDTPGEESIQTLRDWASLYSGVWDGVVIARSPGLGEAVVLTAWTKLLRLESFDAAGAAAFLDLYRGRGPENPVR